MPSSWARIWNVRIALRLSGATAITIVVAHVSDRYEHVLSWKENEGNEAEDASSRCWKVTWCDYWGSITFTKGCRCFLCFVINWVIVTTEFSIIAYFFSLIIFFISVHALLLHFSYDTLKVGQILLWRSSSACNATLKINCRRSFRLMLLLVYRKLR